METRNQKTRNNPATTDNAAGILQLTNLQKLRKQGAVELLDEGVAPATKAIDKIVSRLRAARSNLKDDSGIVERWFKTAAEMTDRLRLKEYLIGVVGASGSGKSSMLNALLDEQVLLPTSCMKACTACPVTIMYNQETDPEQAYRAEVHFVSEQDWNSDLRVLFEDSSADIDDDGFAIPKTSSSKTLAAAAFQRLKAVYPTITKESVAKTSAAELANGYHPVCELFGTVRKLQARTAAELHEQMKQYVVTRRTGAEDKRPEFWPLVRRVSVYCKAPILEDGIVLMELPGTSETNKARATVAERCLQQCHAVWVVAPITRAVDDTVMEIIGRHFFRQMRMDCQNSSLAFICTKTDDISISEAIEDLDLKELSQDHVSKTTQYQEKLEWEEGKKEEAATERDEVDESLRGLETEEDELLNLKNSAGQHEDVPYPTPTEGETTPSAASLDDINQKLDSVRAKIPVSQKRISELKKEEKENQSNLRMRCIRARNTFAVKNIRESFVAELQEMDQDAVALGEEPLAKKDEYMNLASSLPVFCISSRVYQGLCGRLTTDRLQTDGFLGAQDTGIPDVQRHAMKSIDVPREIGLRAFFNSFVEWLCSMYIWAADDPTAMVDDDAARLQQKMKDLQQDLSSVVDECLGEVKLILDRDIRQTLDNAVAIAINEVPTVIASWCNPKFARYVRWATYKATCSRHGVFARDKNPAVDFIADILEPANAVIAAKWETAFKDLIPATLGKFSTDSGHMLQAFNDSVVPEAHEAIKRRHVMLITDHFNLKESSGHLADDLKKRIQNLQREASRSMAPIIVEAMRPAFSSIAKEDGKGAYTRAQALMSDHVNATKDKMFKDAVEAAKSCLLAMEEQLEKGLASYVDGAGHVMLRDFLTALKGADSDQLGGNSTAERKLRVEILEVLLGVDKAFNPAAPKAAGSARIKMLTGRVKGFTMGPSPRSS